LSYPIFTVTPCSGLEAIVEFRVVRPGDEELLIELFTDMDETFFRPHPFTPEQARQIANRGGQDVYAMLLDHGRPVAYGMLRGWDDGFTTPALGIAVRNDSRGLGIAVEMMAHLHAEARSRGVETIRLRVDRNNFKARRLYESLSYEYKGEERGELAMFLRLGDSSEMPSSKTNP
jgi:ribosomal protein S18 acetylase RimI-like enzyme